MNVVLVKHPGSHKYYAFSVSDRLAPYVVKGSLLKCKTSRGITPGEAVTGVITGAGAEDVAVANGAKLPLNPITAVIANVPMQYIHIDFKMKKTIPSSAKIARRIDEYKETGAFNTHVEVVNRTLVDGYSAYLVSKMLDLEAIPCTITD